MTTLPRRTDLGLAIDGSTFAPPRSHAGPSVSAVASRERLDPSPMAGLAEVPRAVVGPAACELEAAAIEIDRRARREHVRVTIPFRGPSPSRAQDAINEHLRAALCDAGRLDRLRAVHLEVQDGAVVLSAAGAAHAVEHWIGGTRLTDAIAAAITAAASD